ncbi:MAG: IPTL-CTERM sorting domain-containing protein [Usitatibacter sp.]
MNAHPASTPHCLHAVTCVAEAGSRFTQNFSRLLAYLGFAAFAFAFASAPALAQVAPNLGTAAPFTVLGANNVVPVIGTVTCSDTGPGIGIFGQVGTTFNGGIANAPPCTITGPIISPVVAGVEADFTAALANIDIQNPVCGGVIPIVTTTLPPGVYCSAAGTTIGAGVIITLLGNASDVWVFRVGTGGPSALTLTNAQVVMGGTANACNVYWKTSAAMTSTDSAFVGTVLSGAAANMTRGSWTGRMMARTDATLTDPAPMTGCAAAGAAAATGTPTLSEWAMVMLAALLAVAGFAAMRRRAR